MSAATIVRPRSRTPHMEPIPNERLQANGVLWETISRAEQGASKRRNLASLELGGAYIIAVLGLAVGGVGTLLAVGVSGLFALAAWRDLLVGRDHAREAGRIRQAMLATPRALTGVVETPAPPRTLRQKLADAADCMLAMCDREAAEDGVCVQHQHVRDEARRKRLSWPPAVPGWLRAALARERPVAQPVSEVPEIEVVEVGTAPLADTIPSPVISAPLLAKRTPKPARKQAAKIPKKAPHSASPAELKRRARGQLPVCVRPWCRTPVPPGQGPWCERHAKEELASPSEASERMAPLARQKPPQRKPIRETVRDVNDDPLYWCPVCRGRIGGKEAADRHASECPGVKV